MSRISRYQESILKFIKTKSNYSDFIKSDKDIESLIEVNDHETSIILLTILNGLYKKKKLRAHHGYYMASGIDIVMNYVMINDNITFFNSKYNEKIIKKISRQMPIYIFDCLSQNIEASENVIDDDKVMKLQRSVTSYLHKRMIEITDFYEFNGEHKVHRTDIIKFKFKNKKIIDDTYRKLSVIDEDILMKYINNTYGSVCKCSFVLGWLIGFGEEKMIPELEKLGIHLGLMLKLSHDFKNIERDMENTKNNISTNTIINYGIHHCFSLFNESKTKLLEGCLSLDIYNITIKEIIDLIERKFDTQLQNTDLELQSRYSSFS
jgi:hypothetical protein